MNSRIQNFRGWPANTSGDQFQSFFRINWRLVLGQNDQGSSALVQSRIHSGSYFYSAGERETNVNAVAHFIRGHGAFELFDDLFARWKIDNRQRARRTFESVEMLV